MSVSEGGRRPGPARCLQLGIVQATQLVSVLQTRHADRIPRKMPRLFSWRSSQSKFAETELEALLPLPTNRRPPALTSPERQGPVQRSPLRTERLNPPIASKRLLQQNRSTADVAAAQTLPERCRSSSRPSN